MAQMSEALALEALAHCQAGRRPPLTEWEMQQLIHGWLEGHKQRKDAERYRYLRDRKPMDVLQTVGDAAGCWIDCEVGEVLTLLTGDDADAAVDAAMAAR